MIGGKGNNRNRMYLAGLQAQSSVYGAAIPVYYGCTRGNLLATWIANLRQGSSSKKAKKKGVTTYVENVDFLIGHNPIAGVLQVWNNNSLTPLVFKKLTAYPTYPIGDAESHVTIADPDFYFVVGVTFDVPIDVTFDDYGGQGSFTIDETQEQPLWNVNYAGPDPTSQNGYRQFPWVYQWLPYSGPTVVFPSGSCGGLALAGNSVNIYYAALNTADTINKLTGGSLVPLTNNRLTFEPLLGNGTEYTAHGANKAKQQIIYPQYAGAGSGNLDLGAAGVAPAILPEVMGMFPVWPRGDADPADMIEDIFKSGPAQAGSGAAVAYGDIHHGLGCLDFPGTVQKKVLYGSVEPWNGTITFDLPNTAGNYLFVWLTQNTGSGDLSVTDTAGNTWTAVCPPSHNVQLWYCVANDYFATHTGLNTVTIANYDRFQEILAFELGGLDTLDQGPIVTQGTAGTYSQSITPTNNPGEDALILSFVQVQPGTGSITPPPFHWETIANDASFSPSDTYLQVDQYRTKHPATYTAKYASFGGSANWTAVLMSFKNSQPNTFTSPLGDILDDTTMQQTRAQCRAYGLSGSLFMASQKKASEWLDELYELANAAPVWAGFDLQSIPYAEQSFAGNGSIYTSPTAAGPVANFTESDFAPGNGSDPPVTVVRKAQVDTPNLQAIQYPNRDSNYDQAVASEPDNGSMSLYGTRKDAPKTYQSIQTSLVARMLLGIQIRETNIVRNSYKFKLQPKWALLLPMDLVTIPLQSTMPTIDQNQPLSGTIALRLLSVTVAEDYTVECEAEPFIYGMRTPLPLTTTIAEPNTPSFGADPGSVNTPVIFEAPPQLSGTNNLNDLWLVISGASAEYGGCIAYISTDGGSSYNPLGPNGGVVDGNGTTGYTVGDWPAHADPDTVNNLAVDLTESLGALASYDVSDENNFVYPFWVAGGPGGTGFPTYELGAYAIADLTSAYHYTLEATGTGNALRRAVYGVPVIGEGCDHPNGSRFAFLDPNNPSAAGILRVPMQPTWIGVTLHFKFLAFNSTFGNTQSLADATDYTYTPTGIPGCVNAYGYPIAPPPPTPAYTLRGSTIGSSQSNSNFFVPFPAGAQVGDLAVVFLCSAYNATLPTGWTSTGYFDTATAWNGIAIYKILASADVTAGGVNIATAGTYDGTFGSVVFVGNPGAIREADGRSAQISPVAVSTSSAVLASDVALYFGSARTAGTPRTVSFSRGSALGYTDDGLNAYAQLSIENPLPGGAITQTGTFPAGYCTVMIVIVET